MKGRLIIISFVLVLVQVLLFCVCVTSRPFAPNDDPAFPPQATAQSPDSLHFTLTSKKGTDESMSKEGGGLGENKEAVSSSSSSSSSSYGEVNRIGSSPPSCEHKCYGCSPCEATQVPTITSHVGIQYTNYEPEGWKCKCGPGFFSP